MTDHNIEPLDVQLTPVATTMLRRHLLKCAAAGLHASGDSFSKAAIDEWRRLEGTPAGTVLERQWEMYLEAQSETHIQRGEVELEDDKAMNQFIANQFCSFALIHYLAHVIKGAQ